MNIKTPLIILLVALFVRVIATSVSPPHLNWDEVSHGYNAYSILKTGRDEWGEPYPSIFRAYGDYKLPLYIYTAVPSVAVFGLTPLGVRLPSALAGSLTAVLVFLIAYEITNNKKLAVFAGALIAFEPWGFFTSRAALEANLSVLFITCGIYFLLKSFKKKPIYLVHSSFMFAASIWTYNSARVFVPVFLALLVFTERKWFLKNFKTNLKAVTVSLSLLVVFAIPVFMQVRDATAIARYENVKILDPGALSKIVELRNTYQLPASLERLAFNRATYFALTVVKNYSEHFSVGFLFDHGGDNFQFNVQNYGLFNAINMPLFAFGAISLLLMKNKFKKFLFLWILVAPIPASITREAPHTLRSIYLYPVAAILIALGGWFILDNFGKQKARVFAIYLLVLLLSTASYSANYFGTYRHDYSWAWQYGYEDAAGYAINNYARYDKIFFSKAHGEPHEFLLFFGAQKHQQWAEPNKYLSDANLVRFHQSNWYWVDRFDKFYFFNDWQIPQRVGEKWVLESGDEITTDGSILLVTTSGNYPKEWKYLDTIYFLNGEPAFDIVEKI